MRKKRKGEGSGGRPGEVPGITGGNIANDRCSQTDDMNSFVIVAAGWRLRALNTHGDQHAQETEILDEDHFPIPFLTLLSGYTLILIIDKVIFDVHSVFDHEHDHNHKLEDEMISRRMSKHDQSLGLSP